MAFNHLNRTNASVDAVVIGAGIAGLYLVQRLKEMGSTQGLKRQRSRWHMVLESISRCAF